MPKPRRPWHEYLLNIELLAVIFVYAAMFLWPIGRSPVLSLINSNFAYVFMLLAAMGVAIVVAYRDVVGFLYHRKGLPAPSVIRGPFSWGEYLLSAVLFLVGIGILTYGLILWLFFLPPLPTLWFVLLSLMGVGLAWLAFHSLALAIRTYRKGVFRVSGG